MSSQVWSFLVIKVLPRVRRNKQISGTVHIRKLGGIKQRMESESNPGDQTERDSELRLKGTVRLNPNVQIVSVQDQGFLSGNGWVS